MAGVANRTDQASIDAPSTPNAEKRWSISWLTPF
jgi:hypothetical protein